MSIEILHEKRKQSWKEYMQGNKLVRTEQLLIVKQDLETTLFVLSQFETAPGIMYQHFKNQYDNITALITLREQLSRGRSNSHVNKR